MPQRAENTSKRKEDKQWYMFLIKTVSIYANKVFVGFCHEHPILCCFLYQKKDLDKDVYNLLTTKIIIYEKKNVCY